MRRVAFAERPFVVDVKRGEEWLEPLAYVSEGVFVDATLDGKPFELTAQEQRAAEDEWRDMMTDRDDALREDAWELKRDMREGR